MQRKVQPAGEQSASVPTVRRGAKDRSAHSTTDTGESGKPRKRRSKAVVSVTEITVKEPSEELSGKEQLLWWQVAGLRRTEAPFESCTWLPTKRNFPIYPGHPTVYNLLSLFAGEASVIFLIKIADDDLPVDTTFRESVLQKNGLYSELIEREILQVEPTFFVITSPRGRYAVISHYLPKTLKPMQKTVVKKSVMGKVTTKTTKKKGITPERKPPS